MNINERENLKSKIEADIILLIDESWSQDVKDKLQLVLNVLAPTLLEGYDY